MKAHFSPAALNVRGLCLIALLAAACSLDISQLRPLASSAPDGAVEHPAMPDSPTVGGGSGGLDGGGDAGVRDAPGAQPDVPMGGAGGVAGTGGNPGTGGMTSAGGTTTTGGTIATVPGQFSLTPTSLNLGNVLVKGTATGTIVMTNTATGGLTGIVITVNGTGFALAPTGTCTDSLAVGQTCNIVVGFTAAAAGPASGSVIVSQGGVTKPVPLTATVQAPAKLAMTPPSAALTAQVGGSSSAATFYVTNSGDVPSGIPTVVLGGPNAADFSIASNTCVTALVGGATVSCQVAVVFSPKVAAAANETATLTVTDLGAGASSVVATLSGTAVPPSTLALTGGPDLGTVVVGATGAPVSFTLTNNGGSNSGTISVATSDPEFVLSSTADLCTGKDLVAKGTCTFALQFKPSAGAAGVVTARVTASAVSTANPAVLTITGTAVPPAKLVASPTVLDFGSIPTGQSSTAMTLTITNSGGVASGQLVVTNTGAQFAVKGDTCSGTTLAATKTCTVIVVFTSTGTTSVEATGTLTVTDGTTTASVSLTGAGVALPSGLLAYYPCESASGTTLPDKSGNSHDATLSTGLPPDGGPAASGTGFSIGSGGKIGNALTLAKAGYGYVSMPPAIFNGANAITVAAWIKVTTAQNWQRVFDVGVNAHLSVDTSTGTKYFNLVPQNGSSQLESAITKNGYGSANQQVLQRATIIGPSDGWKHVAVTLDGSRGSLYVDGQQVATSTSVTLRPSDLGAIDYAYIGKSQFGADPYFDGQIDEFRVYNRALSDTEIQTLAQYTGH